MNNHKELFQRPRHREPSHANFTKIIATPMTTKKTSVEKGKISQIWVRKIDLVSNADDDLDPLDDYSSSGEVGLSF